MWPELTIRVRRDLGLRECRGHAIEATPRELLEADYIPDDCVILVSTK